MCSPVPYLAPACFSRARPSGPGLGRSTGPRQTHPARRRRRRALRPNGYGPAATDIHDQVTFDELVSWRWGFSFNPFLVANFGVPFAATAVFNGTPGLVVIVT